MDALSLSLFTAPASRGPMLACSLLDEHQHIKARPHTSNIYNSIITTLEPHKMTENGGEGGVRRLWRGVEP